MKIILKNGMEINYIEKGRKDGEPILFLHGNGEDHHLFDEYLEPLSGFHLILMDSRGHGESMKGELSYDLMMEDTKELIETLNFKKVNVVGFSDGGIVALLLARDTELINKIFAIGANINPDGLTYVVQNKFREEFEETHDPLIGLMIKEPNIDPSSLKKIQSRVVLMMGDNDIIKREHMDLIANSISNSYLYILKDADHFSISTHKDIILSIILHELALDVYYEDNHVIVVDKPVGVLSQEDRTKDADILTMTKDYLSWKYDKLGRVYLALLQRLDRNVSGLMVFAKSSKAAARLNKNRPDKEYLAIVYGKMEHTDGTLINKISKDDKTMRAYLDSDGKEAILHYHLEKEKKPLSLLRIHLETGRFHQIRFQLSLINHPIFNDYKYDTSIVQHGNNLGLDAYKVSFIHPVSKEVITIYRFPKRDIFSEFFS